jgi:2'-5' RNA ligase
MVPEEVKETAEFVKSELKKLPLNCRFVEKANLHICLSFLGEVEENEIKKISKDIESICSSFSNFEVVVSGIKMIPNEKYIRVFALGIIDRDGTLIKIMNDIQKTTGGKVHPPHLTLCRVKTISDKEPTVQKIKSIKIKELKFTVSNIQIIKSELRKTGPIYTPIFEVALK